MAERYDDILILGYVEGDLSPADRERFERMLAQDPRLRLLVDSLQRDRAELRALPAETAPAEVLDRVNLRIERNMLLEPTTEQPRLPVTDRRLRFSRILAYSGIAAMVLVAAGLIFQTFIYTINVHTTGIPAPGTAPGPASGTHGTPGVSGAPHDDAEALALSSVPSGPDMASSADQAKLAEGTRSRSDSGLARSEARMPQDSSGKVARTDPTGPAATLALSESSTPGLKAPPPPKEGEGPALMAMEMARGAASTPPEIPAAPLPRSFGKAGTSAPIQDAVPTDAPAVSLRVQVVSADVAQTNQALIAWAENNRVVALADGEVVVPVQRQAGRDATFSSQDKQRRDAAVASNAYDQPGQQAPAAALAQAERKAEAIGTALPVGGPPRTLTLLVQPEQMAGLLEYLNHDKTIAQAADIVTTPQAQEWSRLALDAQRPIPAATTAPAGADPGRVQAQARELRQLAQTVHPSVKDRTAADWQNLVRLHLTRDRDYARQQSWRARPPMPLTLAVPVEIVDLREVLSQEQPTAPNAATLDRGGSPPAPSPNK